MAECARSQSWSLFCSTLNLCRTRIWLFAPFHYSRNAKNHHAARDTRQWQVRVRRPVAVGVHRWHRRRKRRSTSRGVWRSRNRRCCAWHRRKVHHEKRLTVGQALEHVTHRHFVLMDEKSKHWRKNAFLLQYSSDLTRHKALNFELASSRCYFGHFRMKKVVFTVTN